MFINRNNRNRRKVPLHGALVTSGGNVLLLHFLLGHLLLLGLVLLAEGLLLLDQADLDVAGGAHVGVDSTMGPVGPPPHLGSTVHLDVLDDQVVGVQALVLSVALRVLQELEQELCGLEGPPALGGSVNLEVEDMSYCVH